MASALILGSGSIGRRLAETLTTDGFSVTAVRKSNVPLKEPIWTLFWDIEDAASAPNVEEKADIGFIILAPQERTPEAYRGLYISGLGNFVNHLSGHGVLPSRLVFVSSSVVFGDHKGEWVNEDTEPAPENFRGETLLQAEKNLSFLPTDLTVVRFSGIYARHRSKRLRKYAQGQYEMEANPQSWMNLIHEDDCVEILRWLTKKDKPKSLYLGCDRNPTLKREYYRWIANELHIPEPVFHPPAHQGPEKRCSSESLLRDGYRFTFPSYREGLAQVLEELKQERSRNTP